MFQLFTKKIIDSIIFRFLNSFLVLFSMYRAIFAQLLPLFFAQGEELRCHVCTYTMDHNGNEIGITDRGCYDLWSDDYLETCYANANFCGTELIADWMPNGEQVYSYRRGCRTSDVSNNPCAAGELTGMQYKDCIETCATDGCNNENSVEELFAKRDENGNVVDLECYSCSSLRDEDLVTIDGKSECYTTPVSDGTATQCPIFANSACFKSKLIAGSEETHFKGCSSFEVAAGAVSGDTNCNDFYQSGETEVTCKSVCNGDYCNDKEVKTNGLACYACEVTFNQMGQMVGWGDFGCYQDLADHHLQLCSDEASSCVTQFEADWRVNGQQTFTMRRGCGSAVTEPGCLSVAGDNGNYHAKRCTETCTEGVSCNGDNAILKQFSQGRVKNCKTCSDHLDDPLAIFFDCSQGETSRPCPEFADAACFSSRKDVQTGGMGSTFTSDSYHGCSAFRITEDSKAGYHDILTFYMTF